jgi:predicted dehydrogenase
VTAGKAPSPSGEDGLKALALAEAAIASARSGNAVAVETF